MTTAIRTVGRTALIALLLFIGTTGTLNLASRMDLPVEVGKAGERTVITKVKPRSHAERLGVQAGDVVMAIGGQDIRDLAQAEWMVRWVRPRETLEFTLQRGDSTFRVPLTADERFPLGFLIVDRVTGLAFIILGLLVWWPAGRDPTVRAFMRVNLATGIAVLLYSYENHFSPRVFQDLFTVSYLAAHCLVPAALTDFLFRFTQRSRTAAFPPLLRAALYLPCAAIFLLLSACYFQILSVGDAVWIERFDVLHRYGYGTVLAVCALLSISRLLFVYLRPISAWEKNRNRWLLICTIGGVAPYVFLDRVPALWGWGPLLPRGAAMSLLLLAPLGWGMAVASFQMLRVEWTLSRSIVYVATAGILLYLAVTVAVLSVGYVQRGDVVSLIVLLLLAALLLLLAFVAVANRLRYVVDRLYYGDWFSYGQAVQNLSNKLSGALQERSVVAILTEELPEILKIDKSTLLIRRSGKEWYVPPQPAPLEDTGDDLLPLTSLEEGVQAVPPEHPLAHTGYPVALPLIHMDGVMGCLLLGAKRSGAPYSGRDRQLLTMLSKVAGMALANMELNVKLLEQERRAVVVDLAGGIAHEINNALSPLMGQAQLIDFTLAQNPSVVPSDKVANSARIIVDMCGRIKRIAENLNHLSQPVQLKKVPLCLNDVLEDAVQLMTETAGRIKRFSQDDPEAPFQLRKDCCGELPRVHADAALLSQVYVNLILNAADAMIEQGRGVLTVGTRHDSTNEICGFVDDTGCGIPHDLMDKIFQPYFTTKPQGKGTGLGLAMVRSIIEAHDGRITVQSVEGQGTRMEFYLPVQQ